MSPVRTVLVADDELGMRETLRDILTAAGYAVVVVADGDAALRELLSRSFAAAVLDVRMPGRDGVAVMIEAGAPPPPVILITGFALEQRLDEAREARVTAVVEKPFSAPYLLSVLADAVAA